MGTDSLTIYDQPKLADARLILGFSGWMDGGDVSTGTVEYLVSALGATKLADIDPAPFYVYSFPGSMETASLFRPHVKIEEGLITGLDEPRSAFYCCAEQNLILFSGREPNMKWREYAECFFSVTSAFHVTLACFVGSVAGLVPHTREPRMHSSVSDESLMPFVQRHGLVPSNYEGPASFVTYLTAAAKQRRLPLAALVAEVPAYVQGRNPKCIEAAVRRLAAILNLAVDLDSLKSASRIFEKQVTDGVHERPELAKQIRALEQEYDQEVFDTSINDDLKEWFENQGIRLD